jgi:hypothetical protein
VLTRLQRVFGHPVLSIGIGFPEESEKFCTLGKIALINQHLWHSQKMTLKRDPDKVLPKMAESSYRCLFSPSQ